jgi:DNA-binding IclR family transcriptional regulator
VNKDYTNKKHKQLAGTVSRLLRILRNHGLIRKLPKHNRYLLTSQGRQITSAMQIALSASVEELLKIASKFF